MSNTDNIETLTKCLNLLKSLYYHPFFYKITSVTPKDLYSLFFTETGQAGVSVPFGSNKYYKDHETFFLILPFIYIDVTMLYKFLNDKTFSAFNTQIEDNIYKIENVKLTDIINEDSSKIYNTKNDGKEGIVNIYINNNQSIDNKDEIIEYYKNSKFLTIKNFINYSQILLNIGTEGTSTIINALKILNNVIFYNLDTITKIIDIHNDMIVSHSDMSNQINKIDNIISLYSSDTILTYLKLRSDDTPNYNKRFNIDVYEKNNVPKLLKLDYNNDNVKYYNNDGSIALKIEDKSKIPSLTNIFQDDIVMEKDKYNNTYILGPFTQVYGYNYTNKNIADNMKDIINSLINKKPVFIIGYGASGAGKTSSLVYLNKPGLTFDQKNGILIHICNIMSTHGYNKIHLKCREFYVKDDKKNITYRPENKTDYLEFNYDNGIFKLSTFTDIDTQEYKFDNTYKDKNGDNTIFNNNTTLGEFIIHLIDNDRYVAATTNNKNSSRSHSLVFVKLLKDDGENTTLIVGDFAGVENLFNCDSTAVQEDFFNVERDNPNNDKDKSEIAVLKQKYDEKTCDEKLGKKKGKKQPATKTNYPQEPVKECREIQEKIDMIGEKQYYLRYPIKELYDKYNDEFKFMLKTAFTHIKNDLLVDSNLIGNNKIYYDKQINDVIEKCNQKGNQIVFDTVDNKDIVHKDIVHKDIVHKDIIVDNYEQYISNLKLYIIDYLKKNIDKIVKDIEDIKNYKNIIKKIFNVCNISSNNIINSSYINSQFTDNDDRILFMGISGIRYGDDVYEIYDKIIKAKEGIKGNHGFINNIYENWVKLLNMKQPDTQSISLKQYYNNVIMIPLIKEILNEQEKTLKDNDTTNKKLTYGKGICEIRRKEGVFINSTLKDIRDIINYIIIEKNKYKMTISPPFVDECLNFYCNKDNCFKLDRKEIYKQYTSNLNNSTIDIDVLQNKPFQSLIFNVITEEIGHDIIKLIISIFCVFNMSKKANNPPPIPYIDINGIKYDYNNQDYENLLNKLKIFTDISNDKNILNKFNNQENDGTMKISKILEDYVFKNMKKISEDPNINKDNLNNYSEYMNSIQNFITFMDNYNSSSAIGTLEFVDALSKYNTIRNMCEYKNLNDTNKKTFKAGNKVVKL